MSPLAATATALGDHRYDDRFGDYSSPNWMADGVAVEQDTLDQLKGVDTQKLGKHLFDTLRIIAVPIQHEEFEGLRVTPCVYTTTDEVDLFAEAMEQVIARGLPA